MNDNNPIEMIKNMSDKEIDDTIQSMIVPCVWTDYDDKIVEQYLLDRKNGLPTYTELPDF